METLTRIPEVETYEAAMAIMAGYRSLLMLGFERAPGILHDSTVPEHEPGTGRG